MKQFFCHQLEALHIVFVEKAKITDQWELWIINVTMEQLHIANNIPVLNMKALLYITRISNLFPFQVFILRRKHKGQWLIFISKSDNNYAQNIYNLPIWLDYIIGNPENNYFDLINNLSLNLSHLYVSMNKVTCLFF